MILVFHFEIYFPPAEEQTVGVKRIITHEDYDDATLDNDFALLFLSQKVNLGKEVQVSIFLTDRDLLSVMK